MLLNFLFPIVLLLKVSAQNSVVCPTPDWKYDETVNACFLPVLKNLTWEAALSNCAAQNSTLMNVRTKDYNKIADEIVLYDEEHVEWWTGGSRPHSSDRFVWSDGSTMGYTQWNFLYPKSGPHNCIAIHMYNAKAGGWQNEDCTEQKPSICVIEKYAPLPTENTGSCPQDKYNTPVGTVQSPGWPGLYPNMADCFYFIAAPAGKKVKLTFDFFKTENCCDWLYIHDGPYADSPRIASLRGPIANGTFYTSKGSAMTLRFTSDETTNDKGFFAHYESV